MTTYGPLTDDPSEEQLTFLLGDSPAKISPSLASRQGLLGSDPDSGRILPAFLAKYDLATRSWRTSQLSFLETTGDGFSEYLETWPRSGLMRSGIAYQLPPLVLLTGGIASGLLPTPTGSEGASSSSHNRTWSTTYANLHNFVTGKGKQNPMWPTPTAVDTINRTRDLTQMDPKGHWGKGMNTGNLSEAVKMWPTPRTTDSHGAGIHGQGGMDLRTAVKFNTPRTTPRSAKEYDGVTPLGGGGLNPEWVSILMGFPCGWNDISEGE